MRELPFTPLPFLKSGHSQTILASFGMPVFVPPAEKQIVTLTDGSRLCCLNFVPEQWDRMKGIVVLLHGLGGSDQSHYIKRITTKLYRQGYYVYCLNRRGCGCGMGLAPRLSHGGWTEDTLAILNMLRTKYPDVPIRIIGFSIGGNILLKLLGELGRAADKYVQYAIAVCPLVDFKNASEALGLPSNRIYERYYVEGLIKLIREAERAFPEEAVVEFPKNCSIIRYDELYTAPKWGYKGAYDYYAKNSSATFVPQIKIPCDILCSRDDPFIRFETLSALQLPPTVNLWHTKHGGHMGFLGSTDRHTSFRWMDQTLLSWISASHI